MLNLLVTLLLCFQEPQFPANQGAINDFANIMSEEDKTKLRNECAALRDSGGAAVVVVTTPSLYGLNVEDYANQLFKKWGIGKKKEDNGILILVAPNEKKVRIEVGYGNEARLTDLEAKGIITDVIRPLFRAGKVSASIVAGTEAVLAKVGGTGAQTPVVPAPSGWMEPKTHNDEWLILGLPALFVLPVGLILLILFIVFLAKMGALDGGGGYSSYGGGGGGWGGGGSSSSDSSSSYSSGESSSGGGGDSGGGGASGDL
jgi:uncharacterized protein